MNKTTNQLIFDYYAAFNKNDMNKFFALLDDEIIHDINQGQREIGKEVFKKFMQHMNECYAEQISDLVIFSNEDGTRAAAEFTVTGTYLKTDPGFIEAKQQKYILPAGAFFTIKNGKVSRITNYYNVKEWIKLVSK